MEGGEAPVLTAEGEKAPVLHEVKQGAGQKAKPCPKWSRLSLGGIAAEKRCSRQQAFLRQPLHSKPRPTTDEQDGSPEGRALWGPPSEGRVWVGAITTEMRMKPDDL